jgi:hypothetical protein
MSKYNAIKTIIDGITFDSKKEAQRYAELKLLERAGIITELQLQPTYILQEAFDAGCVKIRAIKYRGDFRYIEDGKVVVEDTKGFRTKEYLLKRKLFLAKYPEIDFREV